MKVAVIGSSPSSQMLAPFDNPEWDIWVLGNQINDYNGKRITRVFEIHENLSDKDANYPKWLVDQGHPLVVSDVFPVDAENVSRYPINDVNSLLEGEYLSSSPAYMMGLAILQGYEEIGIYGVDMAVDNHEYFKQRPEMYAWIAYAKAKGIKVTIPDESSLFKGTYVEGRDWNKEKSGLWSEGEFNQLANAHQKQMDEINRQIQDLQVKYTSHDGARQVYEKLAKVARAVDSGINVKTLLETTRIIL